MKIHIKILSIVFCYNVLLSPVLAYYDSHSIRQSIIALDKTRTTTIRELNKQSVTGLQNKEKDEYYIFLEYIEDRINGYCIKLYQNKKIDNMKDLPCRMISGDFEYTIPSELVTTEEQIASMDDMLMSSLGDFDEMLLKEEEILNKKISAKNRQNNKKSELETYLESSGKNEYSRPDGTIDNNDDKQNTAAKEKNSSINSGKSGNTSGNVSQTRNKSRKIRNVDDDIVARQLREAAEKETDPELKKKLWEEYEKYKQKN